MLFQNEFVEIDLSSLQEVQGFNVFASSNPNLCYVGDLTRLAANNVTTSIRSSYRRSPRQYVTEHRKRSTWDNLSFCIVDNLKKRRKVTHFFLVAPDETSILPLRVDQI